MTAHEERLVLELQAKWGNRWSRIARKLPGRTDNEIKNYWRTYMRKQVQERKQAKSLSMGFPDSSSSTPTLESLSPETEKGTSYDTGGLDEEFSPDDNKQADEIVGGYSMDDIWECIDMTKESHICQLYDTYSGGNSYCPLPASPVWDYCSGSLWKIHDGESQIFLPLVDQFQPSYDLTEAPSYESSY